MYAMLLIIGKKCHQISILNVNYAIGIFRTKRNCFKNNTKSDTHEWH